MGIRSGICRRGFPALLALSGTLLMGAGVRGEPDTEAIRAMGETVREFREAAIQDATKAFATHAAPDAAVRFALLEKIPGAGGDPAQAWKYFFETSIFYAAFPDTRTAWITYYNVWSDVALVTQWEKQGKDPIRITDAELLMGDFIRGKGEPPFDPGPLWMCNPMPAHASAAYACAETLKACEQLFSSRRKESWRELLPNASNPEALKANHNAIGDMCARQAGALAEYAAADELKELRQDVGGIQELLNRNQPEAVLEKAKETKAEQAAILNEICPAWAESQVVAFVKKNDEHKKGHWFVFLTIPTRPDLAMSLWFEEEKGMLGSKSKLSRVDFIDFAQAFTNYEALKELSVKAQRP